MNFLISINNKKTYSIWSIFIASALFSALLVMDNSALAQPFFYNKISQESKAAKCASESLPTPACKKFDNPGQTNTGGITTGQTAGGGNGSGTGTVGATGGSNTANSAISQGQQSTQSCASGSVKLLPHSSLSCSNTANQGQTNTGGITTGQTAGGGTATP
ncbi:MAG: hypothetical protein ACTHME_00620 [Candidatus Nitrosocosmicus sp.]